MNSKWFHKLSPMAKQEYLRNHPKSKLRNKKPTDSSKPSSAPKFSFKVKRPE